MGECCGCDPLGFRAGEYLDEHMTADERAAYEQAVTAWNDAQAKEWQDARAAKDAAGLAKGDPQ